MPSMRALMTAEKLWKNIILLVIIAHIVTDNPRFFDEVLYILMHGTGIGFSVERQYVNNFQKFQKNYILLIHVLLLWIVN
jgi:ribonucleoside-diphosphate reductase alpha chain